MTCRDVMPLTGSYIDGELPEETCDHIQRHLLRCGSCRAEVDGLRMAVEVLRAATAPAAPSEEFLRSALATLAGELDINPAPSTPPGQLVLGIGTGRMKDEG